MIRCTCRAPGGKRKAAVRMGLLFGITCLLIAGLFAIFAHQPTLASPLPQATPTPAPLAVQQQIPLTLTLNVSLGPTETQTVTVLVTVQSEVVLSGTEVISSAAQWVAQAQGEGLTVAAVVTSSVPSVTVEPREPITTGEAVDAASTATPTAAPTVAPTAEAADANTDNEAASSTAGDRFLLDQRTQSSTIEEIELVLYSVELTADEFILTAAFENATGEALRFGGGASLSRRDLRLVDGQGNGYEALDVERDLARFQPTGGFAPDGAAVGTVTFPLPEGDGPYRVVGLFDFEPEPFALDAPLPEAPDVPNGVYDVNIDVFSEQEVLAPLALRVRRVEIADELVRFDVGFVNTSFQTYGLSVGPRAREATLLDALRRQYQPEEVSDSIRSNITPRDGIEADGVYTGTLTFPRPQSLSELRLAFPQYQPLTLQFDESGLVGSEGASDAEAPALSASEQTYRSINDALSQQAETLLAGDTEAFLAELDPNLRDNVSDTFARLAQLPLAEFSLALEPEQNFRGVDNELSGGLVEMRYRLDGVPEDNVFVYNFVADLERASENEGWILTALEPNRLPPFWWTGGFALFETEHFLLLSRAEDEDFALAESEVEAAYEALAAQGLPLEERYVAYFTQAASDFYELTGTNRANLLGVALSTYETADETINVRNRAFYLNGEALADPRRDPDERQTTITHELVHLVFAQSSRPYTPSWLSEGLAVHYSGEDSTEARTRLFTEGRMNEVDLVELTTLVELGEHDYLGETTNYRYIFSGATIGYLIETFGEQTLLDFYQAYAELPVQDVEERMPRYQSAYAVEAVFQELSEEFTAQSVQDFFELTLAELDSAVKAWIAEQVQ